MPAFGRYLAAAEPVGCENLLTEDLPEGQRFGELTVFDPFAHDPEDVVT